MIAVGDHMAPLNGGMWLAKPDQRLYEDGLNVLQSCRFNRSRGWMFVGAPADIDPRASTSLLDDENHTRPILDGRPQHTNNWDFWASGSDQGFLWYMLAVRHRAALHVPSQDCVRCTAHCARCEGIPRGFARHWLMVFKPHYHPVLRAAYELHWRGLESKLSRMLTGRDPAGLVPLYDHVAHSEIASPRWSADHRFCAARQRTVRGVIERHTLWREVAKRWQEQSWTHPGPTMYTPSLIAQV
jgi:hypothetical protein